MPRVKASPKKCIKSNIQQPANSWVFLLKGEALELSEQYTGSGTPDIVTLRHPNTGESAIFLYSPANNSVQEVLTFNEGKRSWFIDDSGEALELSEQYTGSGTPDIVTLRHPNTGESAIFLFSPANNSVQEVLTFNEGKRSWFIDDSVKSDGKMQLSTPIDPIFLVLPYLRKFCTTHALPLDQLLRDEEFPETERLLKSSGLSYLTMIADRKGDEELNAYKYNEDKTLNWLKKKTERVADILKQKNIHVAGGAISANFVKSAKTDPADHEAYLRYAHGIVSEYLVDDLSQKLLKFLNLPEEAPAAQTPNLKRKNPSTPGQDAKKPKTTTTTTEDENKSSASSNVLDLSKPDTKPKTGGSTSKDKARAKAASGSKSISSFFKKS